MEQSFIDQLIINRPYEEPVEYWRYNRERRTFSRVEGRRPAGYLIASADSKAFDDPGAFVEIPLVNRIRPRVRSWRESGYPGVTATTRRLLEYWTDPEEFDSRRFFFCQLEAVETFVWLAEAALSEKVGINIKGDGGPFERLCAKMATGTGKTIVMAMLCAWQILNKVATPQDRRFSKNVLVVAPGLTVKDRLAVLTPSHEANYYESFRIVPAAQMEFLRRGRVIVRNWHALGWETDEQLRKKRSVDKRGAKSDSVYVREVLGEMARATNLLVINDEAHHAWRISPESKIKGLAKSDVDEATKWVGGLDRIHRAIGILASYDFSATPFVPSGKASSDEALFDWIVSDFGLNDAIESGLVKTPRVVVRDDALPDAKTFKSRLYHIHNDDSVRDDLNRRAEPHEPLPDLVINGYYLLGHDWRLTAQSWRDAGLETPPVMITVANRTETAARVKAAFDNNHILIEELCDSERILHIDSRVLKKAEEAEEPIAKINGFGSPDSSPHIRGNRLTTEQRAERLRQMVDTVGKPGQPGFGVQNVISVGMLSEGWDAKTVTHIMGLRAFSSQLLCEQVVGRGLRRTSYEVQESTGMFDPEYVNIFGVPFTFLPHESEPTVTPQPAKPRTAIEPDAGKVEYELSWPNIIRVEHTYRPQLNLNWDRLESLELHASETPQMAQLAPIVDGKPDFSKLSSIDLEELAREYRTQKIIFETSSRVFDQMRAPWAGSKASLIGQIVKLVEQLFESDKLLISPPLFYQDERARRLIITLNMTKVVQHVFNAVQFENSVRLEPVFDQSRPIRSTADMVTWYTSKPCYVADRSHINFCVLDSTWESSEAFELDRNPSVDGWVKNDHLGFEILYIFRGRVRKYRPDYIVRLNSGDMVVLETKGQPNQESETKRRALDLWIKAVNSHGGFGRWSAALATKPSQIKDIFIRMHQTAG